MAAFTLGSALPIPQQHDADERFAEDDYQHQITPGHCGDPRSQKAGRLPLLQSLQFAHVVALPLDGVPNLLADHHYPLLALAPPA